MASGNFIGLVKIYGEDVLETVKGCEFHYKDSVNRKTKSFNDDIKGKFTTQALCLLTATTPEAYYEARNQLQMFLNNEAPYVDVSSWLEWWHSRRDLIFRAFTSKEAPSSNLAEVIHAGWKNRDWMGVSLLDACFFDVRDSLLLESLLDGLQGGSYVVGYGPNQGELAKIRSEKNISMAMNIGQDLVDTQEAKRSLLQIGMKTVTHPKDSFRSNSSR